MISQFLLTTSLTTEHLSSLLQLRLHQNASPSSVSLSSHDPRTTERTEETAQMDQPLLDPMPFTKRELESLRAMTKSSVSRLTSTLQNRRTICKECKKIDFWKAFMIDIRHTLWFGDLEKPPLIAFLGTRCNQLPTNGCIVCQFLFDSKIRTEAGSVYELRAFPYIWTCHMVSEDFPIPDPLNQMCLAVVPRPFNWRYASRLGHKTNGTITAILQENKTTRPFFPYDRLLPQADFDKVKYWLSYCRLNHSRSCQQNGCPPASSQLIDCDALDVVDAPSNASYVALSYVWGQPEQRKEALRTEQKYSRTILDAITVTKEIGLKYLWVDKHCIDQKDLSKKLRQIDQMDLVYSYAEITIIASDGVNAEVGLPGIGSTPRNQQVSVGIDDITLFSNSRPPGATIPKSIWATRGWTLQEAVLPRRRLVFTNEQIYFECGIMNICENIRMDLDIIHTKDKDEVIECVTKGIFPNYGYYPYFHSDKTTMDLRGKYQLLVKDYTARSLTYDEDSLKGFQGILNSLQNRNGAIKHVWGICFSDIRSFLDALLWFHVRDKNSTKRPYRRCLREQNSDNTRMPLIPSWSWAGWCGKVNYNLASYQASLSADMISIKLGNDELFTNSTTLPCNLGSEDLNQSITLEFEVRVFPAEEILRVTQTRFHMTWDCGHSRGIAWDLSYEFTDLDDLLLQFKQKRYEIITLSSLEGGEFIVWGLVIENHFGFSTRIGVLNHYIEVPKKKLEKRTIKLR